MAKQNKSKLNCEYHVLCAGYTQMTVKLKQHIAVVQLEIVSQTHFCHYDDGTSLRSDCNSI